MSGIHVSVVALQNLRIASLTIVGFDYLMTLGQEMRLYRSQNGIFQLTRSCIAFILVRYVSILCTSLSNGLYFASGIPEDVCSHIMHIAPFCKALATIVSHYIMLYRTYAVSGKRPWVIYFLGSVFVLAGTGEIFSNTYGLHAVSSPTGSCYSANAPGVETFTIHYICATIFDTFSTAIALYYLWSPAFGLFSGFANVLFRDGLLYFIVLTGVNVFNVVLCSQSDPQTQTFGANPAVAATMVMSERIIFHLQTVDGLSKDATSQRAPGSGIVFKTRTMKEETTTRQLTIQTRDLADVELGRVETEDSRDMEFSTGAMKIRLADKVKLDAQKDVSPATSSHSETDLKPEDFDVPVQLL